MAQPLTNTVTVLCEHGLHLRAASRIVTLSRRFQSTVWLTAHNKSAKAGSILGILELGVKQGDRVLLGADGPDAEQALQMLAGLFDDRFRDSPRPESIR